MIELRERNICVSIDRFHLAEEALTRRLRELRPLADQFRKLEQIARRRGLQVGDDRSDGASEKREPACEPASTLASGRGDPVLASGCG